jgi:methionine-rich copper-binding protein CopC
LIRLVLFVIVGTMCALFGVTGASAHARLKGSTPAKGEVLTTSPSQVTITFTQEIQKVSGTYGIAVTLARTGATPEDVTSGPTTVKDDDRTFVSVPLRAGLSPGRYEVHWTNLSDADGDPAEGAFSFYIGVQPSAADLAADEALAAIGAEDETPEATSPATSTTGTPPAGRTPSASATAVAPSSDDGGSNSTTWIVLGVIVAVGAVAGFVIARMVMRRRS